MMYFPYSLNSRNYARTGVIHQLSALCFVFSAAHAAPSNKSFERKSRVAGLRPLVGVKGKYKAFLYRQVGVPLNSALGTA